MDFSFVSDQVEDRIIHYKIHYAISVDQDVSLGAYSFKIIYYLYGETSIISVDASEVTFTINVIHDLPISPAMYSVVGIMVLLIIAASTSYLVRRKSKVETKKSDEIGYLPVDSANFSAKRQIRKQLPHRTCNNPVSFQTQDSCT